MILQKISDFFSDENYLFKKIDYLYFHDKDDHPLINEIDLKNFFFVTEVSNVSLTIMGLTIEEEKEINFTELKRSWWLIRIPDNIRSKLF